MADVIDFQGSNLRLGPPKGMDETSCYTIMAYTNGVHCVTRWRLNADELRRIAETGEIWLSCLSGRTMPPTYIGIEDHVRALIADSGVWKRE